MSGSTITVLYGYKTLPELIYYLTWDETGEGTLTGEFSSMSGLPWQELLYYARSAGMKVVIMEGPEIKPKYQLLWQRLKKWLS